MKKSLVKSLALAVVATVMAAGSAMASPILDFNMDANQNPTTTIGYAGNINPLFGTDIQVDNVVGKLTPLNSNVVLNITGGDLDFATGNLTSYTNTFGFQVWKFGGGGSITLTGDILGNGQDMLINGSFSDAMVTGFGGNEFKVAIAAFVDYKDKELLEYYGLPTNLPNGDPMPYMGNMNLSFEVTAGNLDPLTNAFTSTSIRSGDITNTPTPEPATMFLFGSGLAGLAGVVRRRTNKRA